MANLFPGTPPGYDSENLPGTVRALCASLRSLYENADLQVSYTQKETARLAERLRVLEQNSGG